MPAVFSKWCFHCSGRLRLLSFCAVEHASGLQKVMFPSFWALEAPVFLHSRTCQTVWAQLRKDLAKREQDDFAAGRTLTMANFRQRAAQLLKSYGEVRQNHKYSFLRKLVRGMPLRLRRSRELRYGRCGK